MKLTHENYFSREAQMEYMSVSQFKAFEVCEAAALAEVTGNYEREKTTSLLVGSFVDAHFEGTLDVFKAQNPQLFKRDGTLKSDYIKAYGIINRLEQDDFFMSFMAGKKQVIMTGEISGVPVKVKVDSLLPDKIVDLKVMKDFAPIFKPEQGRLNFIEAWRYDLQGAVYQEIVRQNIGKKLPFYIAAATKEKETDLAVIEVSPAYLELEIATFEEKVMRYDAIKSGAIEPKRCEHCNYCKSTKVLTRAISMEELNDD